MSLTNEQLEERRKGLFATDIAPAFGLSKYATPVQVWMEKCGMADRGANQEQSEAQEMGHILEPVIAGIYAQKEGVSVKSLAEVTLWHPKYSFMGSHFDFLRDDGSNTLVEIKNFHPARKKEFGENGSQDVPIDCLVQCVHEAIVWGTKRVDLTVLFGGQQFQIFPLDITQETIDMVIEREEAFWRMVVERNAPDPVTPEETKRLFPNGNGHAVIASSEAAASYMQLVLLREQMTQLEETEKRIKTAIQNYMGENEILADAYGKPLCTWRAGKPVRRVDTQLLKDAGVYMEYSKESPATRTFLVKERN